MKKLSKKLTLDELVTGGVKLATNVAEESLTRATIAISKNKDRITNTAKWVAGYVALNVIDEHVDNVIGDAFIDIAQGVTGVTAGVKVYNTGKNIVNDYKNTTDEDVDSFKKLLEENK